MALLTVALLFCVYTVTECAGENEDIRIAAPSLIRLCHDVKHKPFFCLICNGFDFSCFSPAQTTLRPTEPSTQPSTTAVTTAGTTAAPAEDAME
ncbi:uncharacterized protein LOC134746380 [Cydia strobilella]|uniref:uncharacterized protein LOC134746380 n=1 Tax=Cydia strobilella TaxID=1100964 RepID=UPI00300741B3